MNHETKEHGTWLISTGWLTRFRQETGASRAHVARMLGAQHDAVKRWEAGWDPSQRHWVLDKTIERVVLLEQHYTEAAQWLKEESMTWDDLEPVHMAATRLGGTLRQLERTLSRLSIEPIDFGMMGLWLTHEEVERCRTQ